VAVCIGNIMAALLVLLSLTSFAPTPRLAEVVQYMEEQIRRVEDSPRLGARRARLGGACRISLRILMCYVAGS
jgi:hypothetical protein